MSRARRHLRQAIGSLLLLQTLQVFVESAALAWVYRGQIMPPYGFHPNQLYDFLSKLRYLLSDWLYWMPALPDRSASRFFRIVALAAKVRRSSSDWEYQAERRSPALWRMAGNLSSILPRRKDWIDWVDSHTTASEATRARPGSSL